MGKFPVDAPKHRVIRALEILGFQMIRDKEHISMQQINADGTKTPLTMPNHPKIKASTLRADESLRKITDKLKEDLRKLAKKKYFVTIA